jgi:sporulation protein YlmC with PRC-barrel domain
MLSSVKDLIGKVIIAPQGEIGRVADFALDEQTWKIRALVVDSNEQSGGGAFIASKSVEMDWQNEELALYVRGSQIKSDVKADADLHRARRIFGYQVRARDGETGRLDDFLFDREWSVRYMVLDTGSWLTGRKVLFAAAYVERIDHNRREVAIDLSRDTIKNGPEYHPGKPIDPQVESSLSSLAEQPEKRGWNGHGR